MRNGAKTQRHNGTMDLSELIIGFTFEPLSH